MWMETLKMWKVVILSMVVFTLILTEAAPKADETENADDDHKQKCKEICSSTGAEMHFDKETLNCKCVVVANVDDAEMALIKKNIQLANLHSQLNNELSVITSSKSKRHLSQTLIRVPRQKSSTAILIPQTGPKGGLLPSHTIPQIAPIVLPRNTVPVYPQNPAIQKHLEKIRARVQELANRSNGRNAQSNLETIRVHLKGLRQRTNIGNSNLEEQRAARAKTFQSRLAAERQRIQQLYAQRTAGRGLQRGRGGVVGAAAADANSITTILPPIKTESDKLNPKDPPNQIVTQPKELVEEEQQEEENKN